jgi:TfoX/Sxy family transcriptional regulator of competence genes
MPWEQKMKWKKPSERMIELFDRVLPKSPNVERKKMFGYPVGFINGNMFMGLHSDGIILRLGEVEREGFIKKYNAQIFEPFPGRKMREYAVVPESLLSDMTSLKTWCEKSYEYASNLKPKGRKKKK